MCGEGQDAFEEKKKEEMKGEKWKMKRRKKKLRGVNDIYKWKKINKRVYMNINELFI
jgi:hypothetical protein